MPERDKVIKQALLDLCKGYSIEISTNEDDPQTDILDKETGDLIFSFSLINDEDGILT